MLILDLRIGSASNAGEAVAIPEIEKIDGGLSKEEGFGLEKDLTLETGTYELLSLTPGAVSNVELCKEDTNSESSHNDSGLHI